MALDPITIVMFALIALLIFFMFRNGKKRQAAMQQLQSSMRPGAEVMLQSGIFGTIESIDEEENKVTVRSGTSTLVVHRNAVSQVVNAADAPVEEPTSEIAPDDDPAFGERLGGIEATDRPVTSAEDTVRGNGIEADTDTTGKPGETPDSNEQGNGTAPKA
ncbi:preprotein translocase subunit YajC [Leucobacter sp. USHLN153]|uniref:preprotein translocase subunit YajC n=1 Tax=Leucobacter sp. USHLN153 TaxID=3081268 RepID=UPI003018B7F4